MKIALSQLNSVDDVNINLQQIKRHLAEASAVGAQVVFFPENALFFRIKSAAQVQPLRLDSPTVLELSLYCRQMNIAAHVTTALEVNKSVYNGSFFVDENGQVKLTYLKMHLFDIELHGQRPVRESDVFKRGDSAEIFEYKNFKFGSSICYDIRFSELYNTYARAEVDVILIPAAFLVKTGQAHWEVLLRARAIESQCYVLAPAQSGEHQSVDGSGERRETFGHTSVVDPWGRMISVKPDGEGLLYCDLQKSEVESVRQQIPMKNHRRNLF